MTRPNCETVKSKQQPCVGELFRIIYTYEHNAEVWPYTMSHYAAGPSMNCSSQYAPEST